jgi:ABC-type long-subunit fatty acid transport system fused permease/ATPase subunit
VSVIVKDSLVYSVGDSKRQKTNLKHFLYTKLKSNYNRLWFLSLHEDKINKDFGNKLRTYRLFKNKR